VELQVAECPECPECRGFNKRLRLLGTLLLLLVAAFPNYAQTDFLPFQNGEELHYDIHYKYGLVMVKAGTGKYRINETTYNEKVAYKSSLDFKSTSFFDKIFKIRDTLNSYISAPELVPLFHSRCVNEGNAHYKENIWIYNQSDTYSKVRVVREKNNTIRMDTILDANNLGYDIMSVIMFVRTLDYSAMEPGNSLQVTIFMGKDVINVIARYMGQSVLEKSDKIKYKAIKLNIDVADSAFKESKNSMEVWISDDKNKIPLKLKAKLKIGSGEASLSSFKNLKYPLTSEINILPRK
jgi:hypothetical protein